MAQRRAGTSPAWLRTFGYTRDEVAGLRLHDIVRGDERKRFGKAFAKAFAAGAPLRKRTVFVTRDGRPRAIEASVTFREEGGRRVASNFLRVLEGSSQTTAGTRDASACPALPGSEPAQS